LATESLNRIVTREAGNSVTNKRFVAEAGNKIVNRASVEGQMVDGVVAMVSSGFTGTVIPSGGEVPVAKDGTVIVESGAAVAAGAKVMTDNLGRAITWDSITPTKYAVGENVGPAATGAGKDLSIELYQKAQTPGVAP
jgi:hypothetical protein